MQLEKGLEHKHQHQQKHEHEHEQKHNVKNQYFAALVVNLAIIGYAVHEGWSSPAHIFFTSENSTLSTKITEDEMTWATTLLPIGGTLGCFVYAYITNHFGRKTLLLFNAIPVIVSWLLICFAENVIYLYVARFLGGFFGASSVTIATIMLSEIANDKIRGILTSSLFFSEYFGIWLAYAIGNFDLNAIAIFSAALMAAFVVLFFFFPESSLFLVKRKKMPEAEKSIRFYKNLRESDDDHNKLLYLEIDKLRMILADARRQSIVSSDKSLKITDFTTKAGRKAIMIGTVLVILCTLNGVTTYYTAEIFEATGSSMPSNMSAIVTGVVPVIAVAIAMILIDRAGRKPLMAVSGFGCALSLIILAIYMMLKSWNIPVDKWNWIPLASYSFANFTASLGMQTLTMPLISEIIPEKIRNTGVSFCMTLQSILQILTSKYLLVFFKVLGFHIGMFIFSAICLFGTLFILITMPETKGKSYGQIMRALEK